MSQPTASQTAYRPPDAEVVPADAGELPQPARRWETALWVSTTNFAEGFPYMIVRWLAGVYATAIGLPESTIGALNLLNFPWNFKFVWAPLVDWTGTKRGWLIKLQLALTIACAGLAALVFIGPPEQPADQQRRTTWAALAATFDPHTGLSHQSIVVLIVAMLTLLAFLAATNDIAIDAFYIAGLPTRSDQAAYSGLRTTAYRLAVVVAKATLIGLGSMAFGFGLAAAVLLALTVINAAFIPQFEVETPRSQRSTYFRHLAKAAVSFLDQPRIATVLAFIACYKLGDELLFALNSTFLLREIKLTMPQFKFLSLWIATPTGILGAMLGAWLIQRYTLRRMAFPLTLAMSVTIWAYVWLAWTRPDPATASGLHLIWMVHAYEQIAAGLGSAVLTLFIVYTCKPEFKAAHFAIGSAIMSIGGTTLGSVSGLLRDQLGYTGLYILAFGCSIPAMVLLPFVPIADETNP